MKRWWMLALGVNAHAGVTLGLFACPWSCPKYCDISMSRCP